jgi:hypothetical protein
MIIALRQGCRATTFPMEMIMIKYRKTLVAIALAVSAGAASAYDSVVAAGSTTDPGYGRQAGEMSYQDWINQRQREGTLGNMPVRPYGRDAYVRGTPSRIIADESTLPPGFTRSDMYGEPPGDRIPSTSVEDAYRR